MSKYGRTKAKAEKRSGLKTATMLLKVVGIGLGAGLALIVGTDKVMSKAFPMDKKKSEDELEKEEETLHL